ncbi:hypothetical protein MKX03_017859 [Papaver bracteatum]|nr:hypothetical protein MKX03_017859 [Papaver bracteatum]
MEGYYTYFSIFLLLAITSSIIIYVQGQTNRVGFYFRTCPRAESIVRATVRSHVTANPKMSPRLLRMHFHNCFVQGCDASILIDGACEEKTALPNTLLRGYEVIDDAKKQLEAICPGVVSCADILALDARDSVSLVTSYAANLPGFTDSINIQIKKIAEKGLDIKDLVSLGLYNFNSTTGADPSIDPSFLPTLRSLCPEDGDTTKRITLDSGSEGGFDSTFFNNLRNGRGILESDQKLWTDSATQSVVRRFSGPFRGLSKLLFNVEFSRPMVKMSNVGVKTGLEGEIRVVCSKIN